MQSFTDLLLHEALRYHSLGMAVHPLGYGGKNPLIDEWQIPPKLTVDDLQTCFEKRGEVITGLGFCSGSMSGNLCVLDFDQEWQTSLEHFLHSWPELTNTGLWSTAHDRRQMALYILNLPNSQTITKFVRDRAIIELRCNGANNVLPPSFHAKCNQSYCGGDSYYEWLDEIEFSQVEYAALFEWLSGWGKIVEDSKQPIEENPVDIGNIDRMVAAQEAPRAIETAQKMIRKAKDGQKHGILLRASNLLGGYVAVGVLDRQQAFDILENEISQKPNVASMDQARTTIDKGLKWGEERPFTAKKILTDKAEYAQQHSQNGTSILVPAIEIKSLEEMDLDTIGTSLDALMTTDYPQPVWIIQDLLPVGLVFLAGKPKIGKSWLMLQMAGTIAKRNSFFGFTPPLDVPRIAIFALEDRPKRLQDRIKKQGWYKPGLPIMFFTAQDFRNIGGDLRVPQARENLMLFLKNQGFRLVIIDTISRACFVDQLKNDVMSEILDPFQSFAQDENVCIQFVDHHSSKNRGDNNNNPIGDIMGATQKGGIADVAFGLYRVEGTIGRFLGVGRDVDEIDLAAQFNRDTGLWEYQGDFLTVKRSQSQQKYLEALAEYDGLTIKQIADCVGVSYEGARKMVNSLFTDGLVLREVENDKVIYCIPDSKCRTSTHRGTTN